MDFKISISVIDLQEKYGDKGAIAASADAGFSAIDFDVSFHSVAKEGDLYTLGKDAVRAYYLDLASYAKELGVVIAQTHGRFAGYGNTPEGDADFIKNAELDLIATSALGAKYSVFHTPAKNWVGDLSDEKMLAIGESLLPEYFPSPRKTA